MEGLSTGAKAGFRIPFGAVRAQKRPTTSSPASTGPSGTAEPLWSVDFFEDLEELFRFDEAGDSGRFGSVGSVQHDERKPLLRVAG